MNLIDLASACALAVAFALVLVPLGLALDSRHAEALALHRCVTCASGALAEFAKLSESGAAPGEIAATLERKYRSGIKDVDTYRFAVAGCDIVDEALRGTAGDSDYPDRGFPKIYRLSFIFRDRNETFLHRVEP